MAKSLRSKRRRKMRAIKRERYGLKELDRLKKTVGHDDTKKEIDEVMTEVADVVSIKDAKTVKEDCKNKEQETEQMDDGTVKHIYNPKTMRDQFGSYPIWMHQRCIHKSKKKKASAKKGKSTGKSKKK